MSEEKSNKRTQLSPEQKRGAICGAVGVIFGILMSNIVSNVLSGQPGWIRVTTAVVMAGILSAIGCS